MSKIELINASCADQMVDVVVNAANRYLSSGGGICGVIFKKAGYVELNEECKKINTPLKDGEVAITSSCNMNNCKNIIHAVGPNFANTPNAFKELFNAYYNSLITLKDNNLHSISFPLISSGIFGYTLENPARQSTKECLKAYNNFIKEYPDYEINVLLCAFSKDEFIESKKEFYK